ncbi:MULTISPECIES: DUF6519 domain-containing protein [Nostocales]|uniref:Uncharacterized protein n=2 Tax=Nostocales TaxID=1161 RepID=A0A0C1ND92_9CYAN|nr:DUF6519 domain-containing protein [Tolypothrix bouteillei]KAF3886720.1 hypothetical protein DA73_0400015455 [Tolypothrix bouteillei VB521301]
MQGEFRGDFTRNTYDKSKQFLRVLMQQGRVQLDADWNEQVSILLDRIQTLAKDIIGLHGGSEDNCGFEFIATEEQIDNLKNLSDGEKATLKEQLRSEGFLIGKGNYYVEGTLCENNNYIPFAKQPNFTPNLSLGPREIKEKAINYLAYLDVWERHITHVEDYDELKAGIREVALGGADTATRSKLVWQVMLKKLDDDNNIKIIGNQVKRNYNFFRNLLDRDHLKPGNGMLRARTTKLLTPSSKDSCIMPFHSKYHGAENQLYRVEVFDVYRTSNNYKVTFVWSRNNSSVVFPIVAFSSLTDSTITLTLEYLKRGDRFSLLVGDWVEIVYDNYVLHDVPRKLFKVDKVDPIENQVTLTLEVNSEKIDSRLHYWNAVGSEQRPLLRQWDSREISVEPQNGKDEWISLKDGVEVQFSEGFYQVGDYWLIPVRTATGDVEWPKIKDGDKLIPDAQKPHGVAHYYAPLAIISVDSNQVEAYDCRHNVSNQTKFELNRVINASWHHDQVFEVSNLGEQGEGETTALDQIFDVKSQDLKNLLTQLGLVIEFQKPVRVDSLHQRSLLLSAQKITPTGGIESYLLPVNIEPVEVKKREVKSIRWFIGNDIVSNEFNLITEVERANNQDFTNAVRLILPQDWSTKEVFTKHTFSQLKVILHGEFILDEEILLIIPNVNDTKKLNDGIIPDNFRQHLMKQGISISHKALLFKEKDNLRWRLMNGEKMYVIRQENNQLTVNTVHALDGNHIWPGVPEIPSGNGSSGDDWISIINILQPQ